MTINNTTRGLIAMLLHFKKGKNVQALFFDGLG